MQSVFGGLWGLEDREGSDCGRATDRSSGGAIGPGVLAH